MSAPAPLTVKVPVVDAYDALPACPVEPTSCVSQGDGKGSGGGGGGGGAAVVNATLSNVDVFSVPAAWLVTMRPGFALAFIVLAALAGSIGA